MAIESLERVVAEFELELRRQPLALVLIIGTSIAAVVGIEMHL